MSSWMENKPVRGEADFGVNFVIQPQSLEHSDCLIVNANSPIINGNSELPDLGSVVISLVFSINNTLRYQLLHAN